jgi:hypothetical protein
MSIVNPFVTKPHRWGRLSNHCAEVLQVVLLFETLSGYHLERAIQTLLVGMTHFATLEQK